MYLRRISVIVLALSLIVFHQNCGDVTLQSPVITEVPFNVIKPRGSICPGKAPTANQEVKFLFIIDMSLSNLGGAREEGDTYYLLEEDAVDWDGTRFAAVKSFIDTCGLSEGAEYSVIGFSSTSLFGLNSQHLRGCEAAFTNDKAIAKRFVDDLHQIQIDDIGQNGSSGYSSPFVMGQTSYRHALTCAETNISVDMALDPNPNAFYQIFFLTDGKPNEIVTNITTVCGTDAACTAQFNSCNPNASPQDFSNCVNQILASTYYPAQVTSIAQNIRLNGNSFTFQPVYYGHEEEYEAAKVSLDLLARIDNPTGETIWAQNLNELSAELCGSLDTGTDVPYLVSNMYYINLTAKEEHGIWYADSDMDGILDKDEALFDPLNARTRGMLDIICSGPNNPCASPPVCNSSVGFLLKDCDVQAFTPNLNGLDTDNDGILDFIEITKGTIPNLNDSSLSDYDGDGVSNVKEVMRGTNPKIRTPFASLANMTEIRMSAMQNAGTCENHLSGYSFDILDFPYVEEVTDYASPTPAVWNLSHAAKENVYLLYYISSPASSDAGLRKKVYGTIIKIKDNTTPIEIQQNNFSLIGEI